MKLFANIQICFRNDSHTRQTDTHSKNLTHNLGSGSSQVLAVIIEALQVSFVEGVTDDFNVHLIQVLLTDALSKEISYKEIQKRRLIC